MHRSTWFDIGASLMRQFVAPLAVPDPQGLATPIQQDQTPAHGHRELHARLAFVGIRTAPLPVGGCQPLAPQTGPL